VSELRGYVVCGEPRSGSTYLTRALGSTGVLGRPVEFGERDLAEVAGHPRGGGLPPKIEQTRTPNGVYGLKVFSRPFDLAGNVHWAEALPELRFIHLERVDLLGQAISNVRAIQTGQYVSAPEATRDLRYNARAIARMLMWIAHNQARWRVWFARNGLTPLHLTYEEVTADPQAAAEAVARHIGLATVPKVDLSRVALDIQRDRVSDEWRRRFIAERRDLGYLDDDLWGLRTRLRRWYAAVR
jgi:LPS sulfotransferase NodH